MRTLTIQLSSARQYYFMMPPPDGVNIQTPPPPMKKSFGPIDQITVNIDIDLAKIAAIAVAAWLTHTVGPYIVSIGRDNNLDLDRIAKDEPLTVEAIARKIEQQEAPEHGD